MTTASASPLEWSGRSDLRRVAILAVAVVGAIATAVTVLAAASSPILVDPRGNALWRGAFVALYVGVGTYTWSRRPGSRLGPIVAGVGFLYAANSLNASGNPLVYTVGMVIWAAGIVFTAFMYLCFPRGRLESSLERRFVLALALSTAVLWALILALSPTLPPGGSFTDCGTRCPHNALQIVSGHAATGEALNTAFSVVFTISLIGIAMLIFNKALSSARLRRRAITPLALVFIANITEFVIALFVAPAYPDTRAALKILDGALTSAIPIAMLIGQVRGHVFAAKSLGQIAVRAGGRPLTAGTVQKVIRDALRDPTIALALWAPERAEYVDVEGVPVELRTDAASRGVTRVTRDDQPVAALIHDPTLHTDSDVVEGLAATSLMLLENARLLEELRASRARIVETAERERRRLERDLHDGAQQRLVAIQIRLDIARNLADSAELETQLDRIQDEATAAVDELRTLARGIYPTVLEELGVGSAVRSLTTSVSVPMHVIDDGFGRASAAVEAAIYFCVREAIQNATKHAGQGSSVTVTLARREATCEFTVSDDGTGMALDTRANGIGVMSMRDRIEALGGHLEIVSAPGRGTSVHGTVPDGRRVVRIG